MLHALRRKIAAIIAPPEAPAPVVGNAEHGRHAPARRAISRESARRGEELRRLDGLFWAHTGVVLVMRTAPAYSGPLYQWNIPPKLVRERAINALQRLRREPESGVQPRTHWQTLNYLSVVWPADLFWPADIPRPPKAKKEAA